MEKQGGAGRTAPKHVVHGDSPRTCPRCGCRLWHSTGSQVPEAWGWDAEFCPACDEWAEPACEDRACRFCADRPRRPSESPYELYLLHAAATA